MVECNIALRTCQWSHRNNSEAGFLWSEVWTGSGKIPSNLSFPLTIPKYDLILLLDCRRPWPMPSKQPFPDTQKTVNILAAYYVVLCARAPPSSSHIILYGNIPSSSKSATPNFCLWAKVKGVDTVYPHSQFWMLKTWLDYVPLPTSLSLKNIPINPTRPSLSHYQPVCDLSVPYHVTPGCP